MTRLTVAEGGLHVHLSPLERIAALRGDFVVPLESVREVEVSADPRPRGWRAPGTWLPGVLSYGTYRHARGKDFVAVRHGRPAVRVRLEDQPFDALVIGTADAEAVAARVREAMRSRLKPSTST